jgi:hypothetical protein
MRLRFQDNAVALSKTLARSKRPNCEAAGGMMVACGKRGVFVEAESTVRLCSA